MVGVVFSNYWQIIKTFVYSLGSAQYFFKITDLLLPIFRVIMVLFLLVGLLGGLVFAPMDYLQGNSFRIIYLHVPAASVALSGYGLMAFGALLFVVWNIKMADVLVASVAPVGMLFTFIALFTGAVWGKPTWGTWWVWDARLTSMLVLLFLYAGVIALRHAIPQKQLAAKATAWLVLVGVINLPIIKYSVDWWHTLHQPATFTITGKSGMKAPSMWVPLLLMMVCIYLFFANMVMLRMRTLVILRDKNRQWLRRYLSSTSDMSE